VVKSALRKASGGQKIRRILLTVHDHGKRAIDR